MAWTFCTPILMLIPANFFSSAVLPITLEDISTSSAQTRMQNSADRPGIEFYLLVVSQRL